MSRAAFAKAINGMFHPYSVPASFAFLLSLGRKGFQPRVLGKCVICFNVEGA